MDNQINIDQINSEIKSIYGEEVGALLPKAMGDLGVDPADWIQDLEERFICVADSPADFTMDWIAECGDEIPESVGYAVDYVHIARNWSIDSFNFVSITTGEVIGADYEEINFCGKCIVLRQM